MRTRVRFRVWELNRHPIADEFDARSRRPAWLKNPPAGLESGRLFDGVRTGSQQPAALRLRTFNSRLVRGTIPPRPRRSSNLSARTRRNPHQPARPDARPLIFNKLLDRSALADCGRSMGRKSGSPGRPAVPPRCKSSALVDIYRRIGTFEPALTCAVAVFVDVARHDSS
jgi:hypothetical protein